MLLSFYSRNPFRFHEADKGNNPAGNNPAPDPTDPATGTDPKKTDEKQFSQSELEAIVKDRLARAQRKADEAATKAKSDAEQKALVEQGEFKTLAEQRASTIAELTQQIESAKAHESTAEKYRNALKARLEADKKALPAHIVALLDQLDEIKQMEWLANPTNAEAMKQPTAPASSGLGTPPRNTAPSKTAPASLPTAPARRPFTLD